MNKCRKVTSKLYTMSATKIYILMQIPDRCDEPFCGIQYFRILQ